MRGDGAVRLVGFGLQNLLDLLDDQLKLVVFGVEMRRDANACAGAVVNQKIAARSMMTALDIRLGIRAVWQSSNLSG